MTYLHTIARLRAAFWLTLVLAVCVGPQLALADVSGEGDITPYTTDTDFLGNEITIPDLPIDGGVLSEYASTGDLVVGGTGEWVSDTEFGSFSMNNPLFTLPLVVDSATFGYEFTGVGLGTISGFMTELDVSGGDLIVGDSGQGYLDIEGGAIVLNDYADDGGGEPDLNSRGDTYLGQDFGSYGEITVDGFGSRLQTGNLFVGYNGQAYLSITDRATVYSLSDTHSMTSTTDGTSIGSQRGSEGKVSVSGLGTRWYVVDDYSPTVTGSNPFINIGTDRGTSEDENGRGTLEVFDSATVLVGKTNPIDDPYEFNGGGIHVRELGFVDLATGGEILTYDLQNDGVIRGDGVLRATNSLINNGEIRNKATLANEREYLLVGEANTTIENNNLVESLGGEMEFMGPFHNGTEGDIVARDAVLRFNDTLTHEGEIGLAGDTTIYAHLNSVGGSLVFFEDSTIVFRGSITLDAASTYFAAIGDEQSNVNLVGDATLGGFLFLDVTSGTNPQLNDTYDILTTTDGYSGTFANTSFLSDGFIWNIDYSNPNVVSVTASIVAGAPVGADFNGDGIVDVNDMATWKANFPITSGAQHVQGDADGDGDVDIFDLMEIQRKYGGAPLVAAIEAASAVVPEPTSLALLMLGACLGWRRRR